MTIDNDTGRAIASVTLAQAMETYSHDRNLGTEHLVALMDALKEAHAAYGRAVRKGDWDAMLGASTRMESYADKLKSFTQKLATAR